VRMPVCVGLQGHGFECGGLASMKHPVGSWWLLATLCLTTVACSNSGGVSPLMQAARNGDLPRLTSLLAEGEDPNQVSRHGWTPLMFAASSGHREAVETLLDGGADPDIESQQIAVATTAPTPSTTALREAIRNGHVAIAQGLLDRGASVDAEAAALAAGQEPLALLQRMVEMGADVDVAVDAMYTPCALCMAALNGRLENVEWLIAQGADPNLDTYGGFPLLSAVGADHPDVVQALIDLGAEPGKPSERSGTTALLHAATKHTAPADFDRNLEVIRILLAAGADPAHRSDDPLYGGRTAVEYLLD
jgi:ankyrin repeat protein